MGNGSGGKRYAINVGIDTEEAEEKLDRVISKLKEANSLIRELARTELGIGVNRDGGSSFRAEIIVRESGN